MAPGNNAVTASETAMVPQQSLEYLQAWLLGAVSAIFSTTVLFPALQAKTIVAFQLYFVEDPREVLEVIESFTICVSHDGIPGVKHTNAEAPIAGAVFSNLIRSLEEFVKFLTTLPPLPRDRYVLMKTWHTPGSMPSPPAGMIPTPPGAHLWPVKEGWAPQSFVPRALDVGVDEFFSIAMGAVWMKPTSGDKGRPIRSVSSSELLYEDLDTAGEELRVFSANTRRLDQSPTTLSDDLDQPYIEIPDYSVDGDRPEQGTNNTQQSAVSSGDYRRRSALLRMNAPERNSPTQQTTQNRMTDTCVSDLMHDDQTTKANEVSRGADDECADQPMPEAIDCLCEANQKEGRMHTHCSGYHDASAVYTLESHECYQCLAPVTPARREAWLEQRQDTVLFRRLIYLLSQAKMVTYADLSSALGAKVIKDFLFQLRSEGYVSEVRRRGQQQAWRITTDHVRVEEMVKRYFVIHKDEQQRRITEFQEGNRKASEALDSDHLHVMAHGQADHHYWRQGHGSDQTPKKVRTAQALQTPRRSPRIARGVTATDLVSFQCGTVFQASEDWETPPSKVSRARE
ncbi:Meiosis-specific protein HOP1 [Sphaceloma murrayae]|uniref:Meiosis-specific protein HOP1 n=1 Tax=Sphaceloma murrayae TaxID=2082308 RepID=A0A2K1QND5_9PEZI|nr:Meiosis-specific protein HOP1 [Sphaceloma murrayae]